MNPSTMIKVPSPTIPNIEIISSICQGILGLLHVQVLLFTSLLNEIGTTMLPAGSLLETFCGEFVILFSFTYTTT